ncbi:MAG: cadherin domain-containing protein [Gammaproteobacteria bacterium]
MAILVLTVSDGQGGADSATFSFLVTAVNDAPTDISLSALSVDENSIGATIGTITSEDVDSTSATYALSGTDASFFEITADGELKLKEGVSLDFEAKSSLDVTVTATDSDGATFSKTFSISVTDLNDAPTSISLTSLLFDENSAGANLGAINVIDQDLSGGDYTFAITGADKDSFEIVNGELKLKDTVTADYETKDSYSITITATDADGNTVSENLTLLVNNKPDPESLSGTVVDGYVSGSTVKLLDVNGNVLATTTTDSLGRYTLEASDSIGTRIVAEGGVDTSTGEAITVTLSATKGSAYVSALTTILSKPVMMLQQFLLI